MCFVGWALFNLISKVDRLELELKDHRQAIGGNAETINSTEAQGAHRNRQDIDANVAAIKGAEAKLVRLESQLNKNLTQVVAAISAKRATGKCNKPLPGTDAIGAFIDPRSLRRGRSAIERRCQGGQTYGNPLGVDITYDAPDAIDVVTHHAETDATASIQAFSTLDEWKRAKISSSGSSIGIGSFLSLGSSTETQKVCEVNFWIQSR